MTLPLRALAVLAVVLLSLFPATVSATPKPADGCGDLDLTDLAAVAGRGALVDDVFVGKVAAVDVGATPGRNSTDRVLVQAPLAGDLRKGQLIDVVVMPSDKGDGPGLTKGERYVFFTTGSTRPLQVDECNGYTSAAGVDEARAAVLKEALTPPETPPARQVAISEPEDGAGDAPDLGRLLAPGGAIALVGVLGLVLISRVSRQRP